MPHLESIAENDNRHSLEREAKRLSTYTKLGFCVHIALLVFFYYKNIPPLIMFNAAAILIWIGAYFSIQKEVYRPAIVVTSIIMLLQIFLATWIFGAKSGIHMALWPLACIFAINNNMTIKHATIFASVCLISFITLSMFATGDGQQILFPYSRELSILVFGSFLVGVVMSIRGAFRIQRSKLERLANRDALTGLYNRRYFTTFLQYQQKIALRERQTFCLALADIDLFKSINDAYGHDAGDKVLVKVANCFDEILSISDAVCRWGGEEFIIFIPETKIKDAIPITEAIREVISQLQMQDIKITMSFGLIETDGSEELDSVLKRANTLLYEAKQQGRNNVQY